MAWRFGQAFGTTQGAIVGIENTKAGGASAGKMHFGEFAITKVVDMSTPSLFAAASGKSQTARTVVIEYGETNPDGPHHVLHTIKLTNATIVKVRPVPPKKGKACEEITIAFAEMQIDGMRMHRLPSWVISLR